MPIVPVTASIRTAVTDDKTTDKRIVAAAFQNSEAVIALAGQQQVARRYPGRSKAPTAGAGIKRHCR